MRIVTICASLLLVLVGAAVWADQLILKDGTTLEGTVIKQADSYWIRTKDGQTRLLRADEVKEHIIGNAPARPIEPTPPKQPSTPTPPAQANPPKVIEITPQMPTTPPTPQTPPAGAGSAAFRTAKAKAESVDSAIQGLALWQSFLDSSPSAEDATLAKAELAAWKKLADEGAEKVNGKWVGGDELKKLVEKAESLADEAMKIHQTQILAALKKLEEAAAIYPNSHRVNFILGYIHLMSRNNDQAVTYFENAVRLRPNAADALNNLGVALIIRKDFDRGLEMIYKAASSLDTKDLAQNLFNASEMVPPANRNTDKYKEIQEARNVLASKYAIRRSSGDLTLIPPSQHRQAAPDAPPSGTVRSGTGFIIRDDGVILTNRHVAAGGGTLMVLTSDGQQYSAEILKLDADRDLALLKIKVERKFPTVPLSNAQAPSEGAQCYAMGFPLLNRMGRNIKITQGIVSGLNKDEAADIVTDAKVNPGNSGGPLLDGRGLVIGIVTMKTTSTATEDSYGMAISAGRICEFLKKNGLNIQTVAPQGQSLTAEEIVAKVKPATVCILGVRQ